MHRPHANRSGDTSFEDHTQNRHKSKKQSKQASDAHDEDDEEESFSDDSADEEGLFGGSIAFTIVVAMVGKVWNSIPAGLKSGCTNKLCFICQI